MDGWMDASMHPCMDAWMHGCMDARMHGFMDAWMHGWLFACQRRLVQLRSRSSWFELSTQRASVTPAAFGPSLRAAVRFRGDLAG